MEAVPILRMTKDLPGLSEQWQVYVGYGGGAFWWGTTPSEDEGSGEDEGGVEWIDHEDAAFIAEYLFEHADNSQEEMLTSLEKLGFNRPEFRLLSDEFRKLMLNG
jgi:hypothetical protein